MREFLVMTSFLKLIQCPISSLLTHQSIIHIIFDCKSINHIMMLSTKYEIYFLSKCDFYTQFYYSTHFHINPSKHNPKGLTNCNIRKVHDNIINAEMLDINECIL
jgi:recombinational DNA repair protein RecR